MIKKLIIPFKRQKRNLIKNFIIIKFQNIISDNKDNNIIIKTYFNFLFYTSMKPKTTLI